MNKKIFLSHVLDINTPTYGGRGVFDLTKKSAISEGSPANDSHINCTVHVGTHIDMPYHFFDNGQTIESFGPEFWFFNNPGFISITPEGLLLDKEVRRALEEYEISKDIDILIVRTGIEDYRGEKKFWEENPGFSVELCHYLKEKFKSLRVIGFDSISVSSFQHRMVGREAHKILLNPNSPILILEDMKLKCLGSSPLIKDVIVLPMRIGNSDGMPCTVIATVEAD